MLADVIIVVLLLFCGSETLSSCERCDLIIVHLSRNSFLFVLVMTRDKPTIELVLSIVFLLVRVWSMEG